MKPEIAGFVRKLRVWKAYIVRKTRLYSKEWLCQVIQTQNDWYQMAHDWVASRAPTVTSRYDGSPRWFKTGLF